MNTDDFSTISRVVHGLAVDSVKVESGIAKSIALVESLNDRLRVLGERMDKVTRAKG